MLKVPLLVLCSITFSSCTTSVESPKSQDEAKASDLVARYKEYVGDGDFRIVYVDLEDCSLTVSTGPMDSLHRTKATCSANENATGLSLVDDAAWAEYDRLDAETLNNDAGSGDRQASATNEESDCPNDSECAPEEAGELGNVDTQGDGIEGVVFISRGSDERLMLSGEATGETGRLIQYFRTLHEQYQTDK